MIKWAFIGYNTSITMISWHIMYKITSYDKPKLDDRLINLRYLQVQQHMPLKQKN